MEYNLNFNEDNYTIETIEMEGKELTYRAFEKIPYVKRPIDDQMQRLSIFVPAVFYEGQPIGEYHLKNAPIFLPNTVGGYMPGPAQRPGKDFMGRTNAAFWALLHGYVVVSPGVRGRGMKDENGRHIGIAPAGICDLKAAIRYLRYNAGRIPGNVEKIISNGTSAGGAMSSLLGAAGNHPDYEPFLKEMGAAHAKDNIFAASCYCPITNLDHADMAYEWEFCGENTYHSIKFAPPRQGEEKPKRIPEEGMLTEGQQRMSEELKQQFPAYLNSLHLKDAKGNDLVLDAEGNGSFKEYVKSFVITSAQKELDKGRNLSDLNWISVQDGKVSDIDFRAYVSFRTRMKPTPAFDNVAMGTPENELFGTETLQYRHFTRYSYEKSSVKGELADENQIKFMNPMNYIEDKKAEKAEHFRIRHGAADRDTSLAISAMLAAKLQNCGVQTELAYPWGIPHAGDYDLEELFQWIDSICL